MKLLLMAIALIQLTSPQHQQIFINPAEVTSIREPRGAGVHFAPGVKCLIVMVNRNFITVTETCEEVRKQLEMVK